VRYIATRYLHAPRGIYGQESSAGVWTYPLQDGLGSVRTAAYDYTPYGVPATPTVGFAFAGEPRDASGLQYHRARYLLPLLGVFVSAFGQPSRNKKRRPYAV
jgi:hypothetical protein